MFEVVGNLRLLLKYDERDPNTLSPFLNMSLISEVGLRLTVIIMQSVLTGKAQEDYSVLSATDS